MKANKMPNFSALKQDEIVEMYLYDEIGGWGIWADDVAFALRQHGTIDTLMLRFHSPGGDMQEAAAMRNLVQSAVDAGQVREVVSVVDGRAYSAATYLALAGSHISMSALGLWMIHRPRVRLEGTSDDLRKTAEIADALEKTVNDEYAQRTGQALEQVEAWVRGEGGGSDGTVFTAQRALDAGFIDEIASESPALDPLSEEFENKISEDSYSGLFLNSGGQSPLQPVFLNAFCKVPKALSRPFAEPSKARYQEAQKMIAEILS